jgi:hypothetical protein
MKRILNVIHDRVDSVDSLVFGFYQFLHAGRLYPYSSDSGCNFFSGGIVSEKRQESMRFKNKDVSVAGLGILLVLFMLVMGYSIAQTSVATPGSGGTAIPAQMTITSTSMPVSTATSFPNPIPGEGIQPGHPANVSPTRDVTQVTP